MKKIGILALSAMLGYACTNEQAIGDVEWQGHRGARGNMPENSLPGFEFAIDQGITTLEMDVIISGDGQVVVSHEPYVNKNICLLDNGVTIDNEDGYILYRMGYEEIKMFDCGSIGNPDFPEQKAMHVYKPLLLEVIEKMDKHAEEKFGMKPKYNIELKSEDSQIDITQPTQKTFTEIVLKALDNTLLVTEKRVNLQSFDPKILEVLHAQNPEIPLAYLVEEEGQGLDAWLGTLTFTPAIISPHFKLVTPEMVEQAHAKEIKVIPWTVNDSEVAKKLIRLGVDGVITDYPRLKAEVSG